LFHETKVTGMYLFSYWNGPAPEDDQQQQNEEKENEVEPMIENKTTNEEKETAVHQTGTEKSTKLQNDIEIKSNIYLKLIEDIQKRQILQKAATDRQQQNDEKENEVEQMIENKNINEEKETTVHQTVAVFEDDELTKLQNDIAIKRDIIRKRIEEIQNSHRLQEAADEISRRKNNFVFALFEQKLAEIYRRKNVLFEGD